MEAESIFHSWDQKQTVYWVLHCHQPLSVTLSSVIELNHYPKDFFEKWFATVVRVCVCNLLSTNTWQSQYPITTFQSLFTRNVYSSQSIIYYTVRSPKLEQWLTDETIQDGLRPMLDNDHIDLDPTFNLHVDEDFDHRQLGVSKSSFCNVYLAWIQYCASRRDKVGQVILWCAHSKFACPKLKKCHALLAVVSVQKPRYCPCLLGWDFEY